MAEIRINATGGVKLYDADDSHYAQIIAGTITANVDLLTLNSAGITVLDGAIDFDIASHDTSNGLKLGGTLVTSTAAELNIMDGVTSTAAEINLIDGGTARGTTAIADGDGVLINDGGTMRQTTVETLATYVGDNTPYFLVEKSTNQTSVSDNTYTQVTFETEIVDSGGDFASNTFTAPSTGYYYIFANITIAGTGSAAVSLFYKEDSGLDDYRSVIVLTDDSLSQSQQTISSIISLSATDTVKVYAKMDTSGGNATFGDGLFGGFKLST